MERARLPSGAREAVRQAVGSLVAAYAECGAEYRPEDDGYVVLVEEGDGEAGAVREVLGGSTLLNAAFEGVTREGGFFLAVWLANNQFGISLLVSHEPCISGCTHVKRAF